MLLSVILEGGLPSPSVRRSESEQSARRSAL